VQLAANGVEALRLLRSSAFDLVLLDLIMPGLDGYQVLVKMRSEPILRDVQVIMLSALDQEEGIARCLELGAEDYVSKPFSPVFLRARIEASLERKRLRDQERETYAALQASEKRLSAELADAAKYVQSLLPASMDGDIRADWRFQPSDELGGDIFGYHWINPDPALGFGVERPPVPGPARNRFLRPRRRAETAQPHLPDGAAEQPPVYHLVWRV